MSGSDGKELEDFVSDTILSIMRGVNTAATVVGAAGGNLGAVNPFLEGRGPSEAIQNISFDVAVSAGVENSGRAGAGIKVLSVDFNAGGDTKKSDSRVSRISFSVPVIMRSNIVG